MYRCWLHIKSAIFPASKEITAKRTPKGELGRCLNLFMKSLPKASKVVTPAGGLFLECACSMLTRNLWPLKKVFVPKDILDSLFTLQIRNGFSQKKTNDVSTPNIYAYFPKLVGTETRKIGNSLGTKNIFKSWICLASLKGNSRASVKVCWRRRCLNILSHKKLNLPIAKCWVRQHGKKVL